MIGKKILNYKIESLIGEGGMGNVYLAEHESIGRKVAIKALRPELANNDEIRSRFKNEASVMARLQHPGIVALYDYVDAEDGLYLVMEYVKGQELTEMLKKLDQPLSIDRTKKIMERILNAFAYAHKNGIVHRDVKPSNIIIDEDDNVKILDFGIAKLVGESQFNLTKTGTQVGTVYYMSPEQVKAKELDQRSDIYSLGITFYEMLAGFCPYTSMTSEYEVYDKIVREPLHPLTETMGDEYGSVWNVIEKATEKKPEDRFQNCDDFTKALSAGVASSERPKAATSTASMAKPSQPVVEKQKSSNAWLVILIVVVLAAAAAIIFVPRLLDNGDENEEVAATENYHNDEAYAEEQEAMDSETEEAAETPMIVEPDNWLTDGEVHTNMSYYYMDIESDDFNAYNYYAANVSQYITKKNVTPGSINKLREENTEFLNTRVFEIYGLQFDRVENSISYYTFWIDFQCFRRSKSKIQQCQTKVEVGFNMDNEITSYKELTFEDLKFVSPGNEDEVF